MRDHKYNQMPMTMDMNMMGMPGMTDMQQTMTMPLNSQPYFVFDPYVFQTLQTVVGRELLIETVKDSTRGKLMDVKPDHISLQAGNEIFFIRICQIVSIMPIR